MKGGDVYMNWNLKRLNQNSSYKHQGNAGMAMIIFMVWMVNGLVLVFGVANTERGYVASAK